MLLSDKGGQYDPLTIRLLGGFEVQLGGVPLPPVRTQKGKQLLAFLALYAGKNLGREWLAEQLWPDSLSPRENLKRSLTDLRKALGRNRKRILSPGRDLLCFDAVGADIDVLQFDEAIQEAKRSSRVFPLRKAVEIYKGPLLQGWSAEWIGPERSWRSQALLEALVALAEQAVQEGAYADALTYANRAIVIDPLLESAYRTVMRAHAGRHDLAAVTQTLRQLEARLALEFADADVHPDPLTLTLHDTLLMEANTRDATFDLQPDLPLHNLPSEARRFIGRDRMRITLLELVRGREKRLVTITGIGGMGKSHLARQVAFEMVADFPDGVWLIDCHALRDREDVLGAICAALHIKPGSDGFEGTLNRTLLARKTLLLLDGFETVVAHASCIEGLLRNAPQVQCLVTSRHTLGLAREMQVSLDPMEVARPSSEQDTLSEGMTLFIEAAGHVLSDFRINTVNRDLVEQICSLLDGIPLAIILAAGFLRTLSLPELLGIVQEQRFQVLRRREVGEDDRHADLQQVIAESILALESSEQRYLRRMSIFVGGFDYTAARQVCVEPEEDSSHLLELLSRLHDHSLLSRRGEPARLQLLDTVRECLETLNLQEGSDAALAQEMLNCRFRHAAYYAPLAQRIHTLILDQGDWSEGVKLLWRDIGNLRAAIACCIADGRDDLLIDYARTLARTLAELGLATDFQQLAQAAEQAAEKYHRPEVIADMLALRGMLARRNGQREQARLYWERRLELVREYGTPEQLADVLYDLAGQARVEGDPARCKRLLAECLNLARVHKLPNERVTGHLMAAQIALAENRPRQAMLRAQATLRALGEDVNRQVVVYAWGLLAKLYLQLGELQQAETLFRQAITAYLEGERAFEVGYFLSHFGVLCERQKRVRQAALAFLIACRIHTQFATQMQQLAESDLERFQKEHNDSELLEWMNCKQRVSWIELTHTLLHSLGDSDYGQKGGD